MAGAPSARGCDGCRKQKKKCDQGKPKCSRCTRLKIACIGGGERRYIFKQERGRASSGSSIRSSPDAQQTSRKLVLSRTPSDESTRRGNAFISVLEISDIRYALSNYGDLLTHLPSRLGRNQGLDAAVNALTLSYGSYRSGTRSPQALASYGSAILALKKCFGDPGTALAPETLCAMYLCTISQSFIADGDDLGMTSSEAMAQIMQAAVHLPWAPGFEAEVLTLMTMPVLIDSIFEPKVELEPWIWTIIEMYEPIRTPGPRLATPFESLHLRNIAKFAIQMREPQLHVVDFQDRYERLRTDLPELRRSLDQICAGAVGIDEASMMWSVVIKALTRIQAAYTMLLTMALTSNQVLQLYGLEQGRIVEEAHEMCSEVLHTARHAAQFRPFGSSAQPFALVAVDVISHDVAVRLQAQQLIAEYAPDFPLTKWPEVGLQLRSRLGML